MLGVMWVECYHPETKRHYWDAVGDWKIIDPLNPAYNPAAAAKWGPSIGPMQIRALRDPLSGNAADEWRVAAALRDPVYNAQAARAIVGPSGQNIRLWSPARDFPLGTYLLHKGEDFPLYEGHPDAGKWNY